MAVSTGVGLGAELAGCDDPPNEVLDQRLGHAGVDVVVAHLVTDAVGAPAERELGEVPGAEHDRVVVVCQPEQVVGAQPGLHVLERDVVHRFAAGEGMAEIAQHLPGGRPDVQLLLRHAERGHEGDGVGLGGLARGEAGQGVAEDAVARAAEQVHRLGGDDQGVGGVEPARDADHDRAGRRWRAGAGPGRRPGCCSPRSNRPRAAPDRRERTGTARPGGAGRDRPRAGARVKAMRRNGPAWRRALSSKRAHLQPLLPQHAEVDIGGGHDGRLREAFGFRQQRAVLVDAGLAVPRQVGGGLASAGGGVEVGGEAAGGLGAAEQVAGLGAADGDRAARQVGEHGGTGQGGLRAGWDGDPDVLAHLGVDGEAGQVRGGFEQQVGAEGHGLAGEGEGLARDAVTGGEMAALVELAVVGQVDFRHGAQDAAAVEGEGGVEQAAAVDERGADEKQREQGFALLRPARPAPVRRRRAARPAATNPRSRSPRCRARGRRRRPRPGRRSHGPGRGWRRRWRPGRRRRCWARRRPRGRSRGGRVNGSPTGAS